MAPYHGSGVSSAAGSACARDFRGMRGGASRPGQAALLPRRTKAGGALRVVGYPAVAVRDPFIVTRHPRSAPRAASDGAHRLHAATSSTRPVPARPDGAVCARVGQALRVGPDGLVIAACGLIGVAGVAALATRQGLLTILFGAAASVSPLVGARWPLLPSPCSPRSSDRGGSWSSPGSGPQPVAGILFAVTYAVPRLGHLRLGAMRRQLGVVAWPRERRLGHRRGNGLGEIMTLLQLFVIAVFVADSLSIDPDGSVDPGCTASAAATALIGIQTYVVSGYMTETRAAALQPEPGPFAAVLLPALVSASTRLERRSTHPRRGDRARGDHRRDRSGRAAHGSRSSSSSSLHLPAAEPAPRRAAGWPSPSPPSHQIQVSPSDRRA